MTSLNLADNTAGVGEGDYIEIANLQPGTGTAGTLNTNGIADADADADNVHGPHLHLRILSQFNISMFCFVFAAKICGSYFNSASAATAQITACSFSVPFKVFTQTFFGALYVMIHLKKHPILRFSLGPTPGPQYSIPLTHVR